MAPKTTAEHWGTELICLWSYIQVFLKSLPNITSFLFDIGFSHADSTTPEQIIRVLHSCRNQLRTLEIHVYRENQRRWTYADYPYQGSKDANYWVIDFLRKYTKQTDLFLDLTAVTGRL
jgi:hypothetical protein